MEDIRIISAALTGNWGNKENNPAIPMTPEEMAVSAYDAYKAGAAVVHLHMRDEQGRATTRADLFEKTIRLIREKCDVIINMTSSGGHTYEKAATDDDRMAPLAALKPELGTYDCGTLNWLNKTVFENNPAFLEKLGLMYQREGIKPEIEIFDLGMLDSAKYYIKKGVLKPPCHFQFIMGAPGGMAGTIENLVYLPSQLPEGSTWSASGLREHQVPVLLTTLALGGHVRVGLEDNIYYEKGVLAKSNAQLVSRAADIMKSAGMRPATPQEARTILGLTR